MSKLFFSSTQLYRTAPTIGGIMLLGSLIFYKEQYIPVLLLEYSLIAFIFFFIKSLREFFKIKESSFGLVIVIMIISLVGQIGLVLVLPEKTLQHIFIAVSIAHGVAVQIIFTLIFNPAKLSRMGWVDLDSKQSE